MKFGYYVIYGKGKEGLETLEDYEKTWAEFEKPLKTVDLELVFWGSPFGTTEEAMCVLKGDITNFEKIWNNPEVSPKFPLTDRRTNFILVP